MKRFLGGGSEKRVGRGRYLEAVVGNLLSRLLLPCIESTIRAIIVEKINDSSNK